MLLNFCLSYLFINPGVRSTSFVNTSECVKRSIFPKTKLLELLNYFKYKAFLARSTSKLVTLCFEPKRPKTIRIVRSTIGGDTV